LSITTTKKGNGTRINFSKLGEAVGSV